jgi:hypothetical protein
MRSSASELAAAAKEINFRAGDSVVLRADTSAGRLADSEAVAHARALLADVGVAITVQVRSLPAGKARTHLLRLDAWLHA